MPSSCFEARFVVLQPSLASSLQPFWNDRVGAKNNFPRFWLFKASIYVQRELLEGTVRKTGEIWERCN